MWFAVTKLILLLLFFVLAHQHIPASFNSYRPSGDWSVFITVWFCTVLAALAAAFLRSRNARIFFSVLFAYAAINATSYYFITGTPLNTIEVERLWQDAAFIGETFAFYGRFIVNATAIGLLLVVALLLPVKRFALSFKLAASVVCVLTALPVFLVARSVYRDGGGDSDSFPVTTAPLGFVAVLLYDNVTRDDPGPRQVVEWTANDSGIENIVVLMDESVRGDYLDLVDVNGVHTHLLEQNGLINFGLAASHANCSAASNLSFRYAVRRDHFLHDEAVRPSLWAYAKKAGYQAIYIDGQRHGGELQNFMNAAERDELNQFIQHDDNIAIIDRDQILADRIAKTIAAPGKKYIYVNKSGVHFPYENKYPESKTLYTPKMSSTQVHGGESNNYGGQFGSVEFRNSYRNAVAWNTGEFFKRLLPQIDLSRTLLIYTSDHGQNFTKVWEVGYLTHCTWGPAPAPEGTVPLAVITDIEPWLTRLRAAEQRHRNRASHWNVPSSILLMMGYDADLVNEQYEPTLFSEQLGHPSFVSTYFVRFGLKPVWNDAIKAP